MPEKYRSDRPSQSGKQPILGQGHSLSDTEGEMIKQMIREEQHPSRKLFIPQEDLAAEATTTMSPATAHVIGMSRIRPILDMFNRDFLYGQGRFDAYKDGLIFKWGDGYSRRHIWATVENDNLILETSHAKKCDKPYCNGTHHVLTPDLYTNIELINQELGERFRRPVYETPED
ncbi:hypothetical protein [Dictyobacter arantiisoli]|uniref:Uncharacterized protein n=1 Tax=Dictyobacter arantiisoli TaxID=2014874 RepID=A0A5A5TE42_9CHLR|nr:hypothetical protein [Dictyobacter arantiisoli]GCF09174.1 hypothetical protein KDI_27380 [Dictyobacter arantiisoli]